MNRASVTVGWMKVYVIESKNGIIKNVAVSVKYYSRWLDFLWRYINVDS